MIQPTGRYFQKGEVVQDQWLRRFLQPKEIALAWLSISSLTGLHADALSKKRNVWRYLLTSQRSALVVFSEEEQILTFELPAENLNITNTFGRDIVSVGEFRWKTQFSNDSLYHEIVNVPGMKKIERLRMVARLNWIHQDKKGENTTFCRWLLTQVASETKEPLDHLTLVYVRHKLGEGSAKKGSFDNDVIKNELNVYLKRIIEYQDAAERLKRWSQDWKVPIALQMHLVDLIRNLDLPQKANHVSLCLHRSVREIIFKDNDYPDKWVIEISFAKHLLQMKQQKEAVEILENCLRQLPEQSLSDLLPSIVEDMTLSHTKQMRYQILELLVEARGEPHLPDPAALTELAILQPLVIDRLDHLIKAASDSLRRRASKIRQLLQPDGLRWKKEAGKWEDEISARFHPLPKELIQSKLPHPAAREGGPLESLQIWLGKAKVPDYSALKSYVERVTVQNHKQVMEAVSDASIALGIKAVEAYISRGDKGVGIKAYEGSPPFLLIGGDHLDSTSDYFMRFPELRFAIAAEMAHLYFHHAMLTSNELWDGIFHKGKQFLEIFTMLASPIGLLRSAARSLQKLSRAEQILQKADILTENARKAFDFIGIARDSMAKHESKQGDNTLSEDEEHLLATCRVMQLTADRVGLLLCDDIQAATRAIFLSSRWYLSELMMAERYGLLKMLYRRNAENELVNQSLAIRLAALCSFYLSDDYMLLRNALTNAQK